ncbi:MAG: 50S ribosomal protein L29 [Myxococcota bacterium]|nr:50S ribosomal protein L29 [Myxococcota bacterium]
MASEQTKAADLRAQSPEELSGFITDKTDELLKLRFQFATGQLENVARMKTVRREIARAKTIMAERNGAEG